MTKTLQAYRQLVQEHIPLLDPKPEAPRGAPDNSITADPGEKSAVRGTSSNGSTQMSTSRLQHSSSPYGADSQPPELARADTPEPPHSYAKGADQTTFPHGRATLEAQAENSTASSPAMGPLAPLEQAGKAKATARGEVQRSSFVKHGERDQARKAFAVATLRRLRVKLEGLTEVGVKGASGSSVSALSVEQQVDKLLQQATSRDNLARMYEGWTPWM